MKNSIFKFAATLSAVFLLGAVCQPQTADRNLNTNTGSNTNSNPTLEVPAPNSNVNEMIVVDENENVNEAEEEEESNTNEEVNENVNEPEEEANENSNENTNTGDDDEEVNENVNEGDEEDEEEVSAVIVTFNGSSFSPATTTIKSGSSITFVNNSSRSMQVSSDNHPTHTKNPELGTGPITAPGSSYTVTLTKVGAWGYHDHLNSSVLGKVIVE